MNELEKGLKLPVQVALVFVSAAVLPFCFEPFGWWLLLFFAFILLFIAVKNTAPRRAFYLGMLHGIIGYGATLYWFYYIFAAACITLFCLMAFFTALFCLAFNIIIKQTKPTFLKVLVAATLWTAIEFYRSELFFLRFPWITPGSALGPTYLSPIVGVYGTSFLIIAACAGLIFRRTILLGLFLIICVILLGVFHPKPIETDEQDNITVAAVQGGDIILDSYVELTKTVEQENPDLIVWPEYSLPYDVRRNESDFNKLRKLCTDMNSILIVGTKTVFGNGEKDWYNTALTLNSQGVLGEYYKARPVHFFNDGIPGDKFQPVKTKIWDFATPVCFDCDYTEIARKMTELGAEFFIVPSYDAKSWSITQHLQHAALFRLRAAENRRWLVCAASSGVSQIIDPHGNVQASLPPMVSGVVTYGIDKNLSVPFFVRFGWFFPWLTLGCSAILFVLILIRKTNKLLRE